MATRIYLPSSGSAPVTPSTWNFPYQAGTTYTLPGLVKKGTTAFTSRTTAGGTTSGRLTGVMRYVIGPLSAVQISGTVNLVMRVSESSGSANATLAVAVKIIQPGGADRSVLLAAVASDNPASPYEMTTSLNNKRAYNLTEVRPIPLTAQTPTAGDYLVIEIGFRYGATTSYNIVHRHGDNSASDLADADSGTNDYAPWIDFSQTLPLQRRGYVSWSEFETSDVPRRARISWEELEIPDANRRGRISWEELEVPLSPRRAIVSWNELEIPNAARRAIISWKELEVPTLNLDRRGQVSWSELEAPLGNRRAIISWNELEAPNAQRRGYISWIELAVGPGESDLILRRRRTRYNRF